MAQHSVQMTAVTLLFGDNSCQLMEIFLSLVLYSLGVLPACLSWSLCLVLSPFLLCSFN